MNNTQLTCPICGAHFALPEHEHLAAGIAIGKNSGLGEIHPALEKEGIPPAGSRNKPMSRLEALKAAGIDTSMFLSMQGAAGQDILLRNLGDGQVETVKDNDPVFADPTFQRIMTGTYIPERRLFRRWVTGQTFRMMLEKSTHNNTDGFTESVRNKGYYYQWKMILEEMRVQAKLALKDEENFKQRNNWFNKRVVIQMVKDYMKKLKKYVAALPVQHYKKAPYKRICGQNILTANIECEVFGKLDKHRKKISKADSPRKLYEALRAFIGDAPKMNHLSMKSMHQCRRWLDAYKGAGAYFTMRNLILFHGARFTEGQTQSDAIAQLEHEALLKKNDGYKMFGILRSFLEENGIDIEEKRREWAEAKMKKRLAARAKEKSMS